MKKDLILASAWNYSWAQIDVWALSLVKSGFDGIAAVIIYDDPNNVSVTNQTNINYLQSLGIQTVVLPLEGTIFNQRFYDFSDLIRGILPELRYVVVTDIRDVCFQSNPMLWLDKKLKKSFLAVSEAIQYKNEEWGCTNVKNGFPKWADRVMEKCIYNVGILAGKAEAIADLCFSIGSMARSTGFQVADQSGYNLLLDMFPYKSSVQLCKSEDGFACQAGTLADPNKIEGFRPNLLEPEPKLTEIGVTTNSGWLYPIVHQYDRVPEWDSKLREVLNKKIQESNVI